MDPVHLSSLIGGGFVVGFRHAFEPDHLAAVSNLATRPSGLRGALWLGTAWGVGHTLSFGIVLLLLVALDIHLPDAFHHIAEFGVAGFLILLGIITLRPKDPAVAEPQKNHTTHHSFGFGVIHGFAGSGTLVVLLAATAANGAEQLAYLLTFGVGSVGGMMLVTAITCGLAGIATQRQYTSVVRIAAAMLSIGAGCWLGLELTGLL
ncbi:MAG: HupE/UreJ family protein [Acidobacteriota bacterium]